MSEFGENLRKAREVKGITPQTLAEALFVTRQTVSRWENGSRYPDLLTARKISEVLGTSVGELLEEEDPGNIAERTPVTESPAANGVTAALYAGSAHSIVRLGDLKDCLYAGGNGGIYTRVCFDRDGAQGGSFYFDLCAVYISDVCAAEEEEAGERNYRRWKGRELKKIQILANQSLFVTKPRREFRRGKIFM